MRMLVECWPNVFSAPLNLFNCLRLTEARSGARVCDPQQRRMRPGQSARLAMAVFISCFGLTPLPAADVDTSKLPPAATRPIDFSRDVQPIFEASCWNCHGAKKSESGFRLDNRAAALQGGEHGKDIIPGKSADSLLIHAVSGLHADLKMPKKGEKLTAEQVGVLRAWIDQGAPMPEAVVGEKDPANHWAFKAPVKPAVPSVQDRRQGANAIDAFILERLKKEGLKPSPEADKVTLLRRLHLDLVGLPPTIAEADAFLADKSNDAYGKVVEKLLASPHYGERWGRHWLDAARYADSDGYEKDMSREMWPYRDYVVNALNRDLPYNQFIIEQMAGDQLPDAKQDQIVATGFLRNSMVNMEGAIDPEQFRMEAMFDRMDAIGKAVLGITVQCAQCHTHKFDPISHEEYYRMFAFINSDHEARPVVYAPAEQMKIAEINRAVAEIEGELKHREPDWEKRMAKWEESVRNDQPEWIVITNLCQEGDKAQRYEEKKDGSLVAQGYAPTKFTQWFRVTNDLSGITAFRLEALTDANLPYGGPGRAFNGTFALSEFLVEAMQASAPTNKVKVKWKLATADVEQPVRPLAINFFDKSTNTRPTGPIKMAIDGDANTAWGIDVGPGRRNQDRKAVFVATKPAGFTNGTYWRIGLQQNHGGWNSDDHMNNNLGRFRLSATRAEDEVKADPVPKKVREILDIPRDQRSRVQLTTVFSYWRTTVPEWKDANARIDALWKDYPEGATSMTLLAREEPRATHILRRGDWLKPSREVEPGVPAFMHPLPKDADGSRLTFAKWLVDPKSPTTARVIVNRIWMAYFGNGLVTTPEDFGMQSDPPSHPELLDWLATEFMRNNWSFKHLHRLIVHSATYRQSSNVTPSAYEKDPYNRWLARGSRLRVEGEIVRDIALAVSGLLNPKLGGPSVMPPAPKFLFEPPASYAPFPWKHDTSDEQYRRGIYVFRRRSTPFPALQTFDVPNADASCVRRQRSNSPLQALVSLNEPVFVECSQALARKVLAEGGRTDEQRIAFAFRSALARSPAPDEMQELLRLLHKEKQRIADGWVNAIEIATGTNVPPKDLPAGASPTQLAAYTVVSRVLLNLDETITKE
jgi:mono/diheme cytochrome c family protein